MFVENLCFYQYCTCHCFLWKEIVDVAKSVEKEFNLVKYQHFMHLYFYTIYTICSSALFFADAQFFSLFMFLIELYIYVNGISLFMWHTFQSINLCCQLNSKIAVWNVLHHQKALQTAHKKFSELYQEFWCITKF